MIVVDNHGSSKRPRWRFGLGNDGDWYPINRLIFRRLSAGEESGVFCPTQMFSSEAKLYALLRGIFDGIDPDFHLA